MDLVQWLRDQLDEDERIAQEATPGPWQNAPTARHHATASGRSEEAVFASPPDVGAIVVAATGEASERRNLINAEFIAAYDPARVLREIEAKRHLVGAAAGARHDHRYWNANPPADPDERIKVLAQMEARWSAWHFVLTELVGVYSDRPGYTEALAAFE